MKVENKQLKTILFEFYLNKRKIKRDYLCNK